MLHKDNTSKQKAGDLERKTVLELKKVGFEVIGPASPSCRVGPGQILIGSVLLKYSGYPSESAVAKAAGKGPLGESICRSIYADEKGVPYC